MTDWTSICAAIAEATGAAFRLDERQALGGGCINQAFRLRGADGRSFFVKLNDARHHAMFTAEAAGLAALAATQTLRVPQPVAHGIAGTQGFLVLEHLALSARGDAALLGERLAALHRCTGMAFGFAHDNFIGTTPQPNGWMDDWLAFWRERRLGFQLRLAARNSHGGALQTL